MPVHLVATLKQAVRRSAAAEMGTLGACRTRPHRARCRVLARRAGRGRRAGACGLRSVTGDGFGARPRRLIPIASCQRAQAERQAERQPDVAHNMGPAKHGANHDCLLVSRRVDDPAGYCALIYSSRRVRAVLDRAHYDELTPGCR